MRSAAIAIVLLYLHAAGASHATSSSSSPGLPPHPSHPAGSTPLHALFDLAKDDVALFHQFVQHFKRSYEPHSPEGLQRFEAFKSHLSTARKFNAQRQTSSDAVFGVTSIADMTDAEFKSLLGTRVSSGGYLCNTAIACNVMPANTTVPVSVDWRLDPRSIITPVKNQGQCGACWAFSAVETAESMWVLAGNKAVGPQNSQLSAQELLSCVPGGTCLGGTVDQAAKWLYTSSTSGGGLVSEDSFPYGCSDDCTPAQIPVCKFRTGFPAGSYAAINETCTCDNQATADFMKWYLTTRGPISVVIDADPWKSYSGGIIRHHCNSDPFAGDHAAQLVGYAVDPQTASDYWIVRNQWGTDWGDNGYIYLAVDGNTCGIQNEITYFTSPSPA